MSIIRAAVPVDSIPIDLDRAKVLNRDKRHARGRPRPTGLFDFRYRDAESIPARASIRIADRFRQVLRHVSARAGAREYRAKIEGAETAALRDSLKLCPGEPVATKPPRRGTRKR